MDFRELMRIAAENKQRAQKECKENKRYTTKLPPPKKELKIVDANAIKNRLKTKEELLKEKAEEEAKKKEELLRLRAAAQVDKKGKTKKEVKEFKSSFTATKDKKSYQPDRTQYVDDDHKDRHKRFMQKVDKSAKNSIEDWFDDNSSESDYNSSESDEEEEPVHVKKKLASANKKKGPMSFEEIMRLAAENKKSGNQSGAVPIPAPKESQNGGNGTLRTGKFTTSFNKNHRDRNEKPPVIGNGHIHLKAAAEKYKSKGIKGESQKPNGLDKTDEHHESSEKHRSKPSRAEANNGSHKQSNSHSAIRQSNDSRKTKGELSRSHKPSLATKTSSDPQRTKGETSRSSKPSLATKTSSDPQRTKGETRRSSKPSLATKTSSDPQRTKGGPSRSNNKSVVATKPSCSDSKTKPTQSKITEHMRVKGKDAQVRKGSKISQSESKRSVREETPKKLGKPMVNGRDRPAENSWSKTMANDRDRSMSNKGKVKPSPASMQQYRERPQTSNRPMTAEQRRREAMKRAAPPLPRMKAKHGRIVSDDESDYEEDGFIDDSPMDGGHDVSSYIKEIFGYDKTKYKPESDYALRFMDASYKDIQKEEARSARLGMLEDLEDMRKEKEEEMRKKMKQAKKGKR